MRDDVDTASMQQGHWWQARATAVRGTSADAHITLVHHLDSPETKKKHQCVEFGRSNKALHVGMTASIHRDPLLVSRGVSEPM